MERKQQWFRSDLRCTVSPGPLPFAQVENLPEEFNDLTKNYIISYIANNTGPERDVLLYEVSGSTLLLGLFGIIYACLLQYLQSH